MKYSLFCSYNSFSSVGAFKCINDDVITEVERFACEELADLLNDSQENISCGDMTYFFGKHASNPDSFQFSDDERYLILSLVRHINASNVADDMCEFFDNMTLQDDREKAFPSPMWYFEDVDNIDFGSPESFDENENESEPPFQTHTHYVLQKLLATADQNALRSKAGYRFDDEARQWAAYLRILAGRTAYNALQKNLEHALPSESRINYFVQNKGSKIIEGVPRYQELLIYLKERNMPLSVALSEDATRIDGRVQYDPKLNQLVGFVLPLDSNGMPIPFVFNARNTEEIVEHFTNDIPIAKTIITVMAQPVGKAPPFCLLVFGTKNQFRGVDVAKRWEFLTENLKELGISVVSISSDSDAKYNMAMRRNSFLGCHTKIIDAEWFKCGGDSLVSPFYVQDTLHLVAKMRNLLMKTLRDNTMLQFGTRYFIQLDHLQYLVSHFPKDRHQLTRTILKPEDKQNFGSVLRICDPIVRQMLQNHVEGSAATIKYLELMKNFLDSYEDKSLSPLDRVSKLWYSLFFVRIWKRYVLSDKNLTTTYNFLPPNCYSCLEINAHAMVLILLHLGRTNQPELFKPWLYSSQPCEGFFRQIRSFSPCYSQVTNCTVKEMLHRIHRIQLQNDISNDPSTKFKFPEKLKTNNYSQTSDFILPNEAEIFQEIEKCKIKAVDDAIEIGLIDDRDINLECSILSHSPKAPSRRAGKSVQQESDDPMIQSSEEVLDQLIGTTLKNFAEQFGEEPVDEASQYTEVFGGDMRIIIKKMTLCWVLRKNTKKLSSDRLIRVRDNSPGRVAKHVSKRKKANGKYFPNRYIRGKIIRKNSSKIK